MGYISPDEAIDILSEQKAAYAIACQATLELLGEGYLEQREFECGSILACRECGNYYFEPHTKNCRMFRTITLLRKAVKE